MQQEEVSLKGTNKKLVVIKDLPKKSWWKKPSLLIVLSLIIFIATTLIYGFAVGYLELSVSKPEDRAKNIEKLRTEIEEISKEKELLEQKRNRILEQLNKTKTLVEKSKNSFPEVDAHIQVVSSTCKTCRTPAWIESYQTAFTSLEEIGKIIDENSSTAQIK